MEEVFGITPHPWQEEVTLYMTLMNIPNSGIPAGQVLLVQPTEVEPSPRLEMFMPS
jgi:hypothetical protein